MTKVKIIACPTCKGQGYHEHRETGHNPDPPYRRHLCSQCRGDRVLEETTNITYRRISREIEIQELKRGGDA